MENWRTETEVYVNLVLFLLYSSPSTFQKLLIPEIGVDPTESEPSRISSEYSYRGVQIRIVSFPGRQRERTSVRARPRTGTSTHMPPDTDFYKISRALTLKNNCGNRIGKWSEIELRVHLPAGTIALQGASTKPPAFYMYFFFPFAITSERIS